MTVQLIVGDDSVLVSEAVKRAVDTLLGDRDRALALQQVTEEDLQTPEGVWSLAALRDAAQTAPFLTDRRVVVGRHLARFSAKNHVNELRSLTSVPETTDLVLVWERGTNPAMTGRFPTLPKALAKTVTDTGGSVRNVMPPYQASQARKWLKEQLDASTLIFDARALKAVQDLVGSERNQVVGLLRTLEGALGAGARVTAQDVETYGGDPAAVVPWELDDAIDRGDIAGALKVLHRLLPSRHPLALMAGLHSRYQRMLRLDGAGIANEREAAQVLGMKGSTFPARKALGQARRLGSAGVAQAIRLLAEADMALRGKLDWPPELVMEVLVSRLASLPGSVRQS